MNFNSSCMYPIQHSIFLLKTTKRMDASAVYCDTNKILDYYEVSTSAIFVALLRK